MEATVTAGASAGPVTIYESREVCGELVAGPGVVDPFELAARLRTPVWVAQALVAAGHSPFQTEDETSVCAGCGCGWAEGTFTADVRGRVAAAIAYDAHVSLRAAKVELFGPDAA